MNILYSLERTDGQLLQSTGQFAQSTGFSGRSAFSTDPQGTYDTYLLSI
jgi:hypothetical protein